MNALVPVTGNIVPLIARLGSDHDGERIACLKQLDRVLGRAGVSWTDFARRVEGAIREPEAASGPVLTHWRVAVQWISTHPDWQPSERERQFISDMHRILKRHAPTDRQAEWITGIVERLGGADGCLTPRQSRVPSAGAGSAVTAFAAARATTTSARP